MNVASWGWCIGFWLMFGAWLMLLNASKSKDEIIERYRVMLEECHREYGRMLDECYQRIRRVK